MTISEKLQKEYFESQLANSRHHWKDLSAKDLKSYKSLLALNLLYNQDHGLTGGDLVLANSMRVRLEKRERKVTEGDIVRIYHPGKGLLYKFAHIEKSPCVENEFSLCTEPYIPFVGAKFLSMNTSGGYWKRITQSDLKRFVFVGKELKNFHVWGHCGGTANGAITFQAKVNVWKFSSENFY